MPWPSAVTDAAASAKICEIDNNKRGHDRRRSKTENITDIVSGHALPRPRRGNYRLRRGLLIGLFIFGGSGFRIHLNLRSNCCLNLSIGLTAPGFLERKKLPSQKIFGLLPTPCAARDQ